MTSFKQYDTNPCREEADNHQSYASKVFEPMTLLTALLVLGVGVTAYIYWRQLKKMEETVALVGKQGKTMEDQLTAMQGQLTASEKQAKSMDESVVFGLRAYVGVHSVGASFHFSAERITLKIENIGKVPASKIKIEIFAEIETQIEDSADASRFFDKMLIAYYFADYGNNKLFPGNLPIQIVMPYRDDFEVERHHMLIEEGRERLIVRGNINFSDGFHADKNTPFAFRYVGDDFWTPDPVHEERDSKETKAETNPN